MRPRAPRTGETSRRREITPGQAGERSIGGRIGWLAAQAFARALAARPLIGRALLAPYVGGTALTDLSGDRTHPIQFGADGFSGYSSELISTLKGFQPPALALPKPPPRRSNRIARRSWSSSFHVLDLLGVLAPPSWLPCSSALIPLGGLGLILVQHVSYLEIARVVDRQLGLKAQLGTAVELSLEGEPTRPRPLAGATGDDDRPSPQPSAGGDAARPLARPPIRGVALAGLLAISFLNSVGVRAPARPDQPRRRSRRSTRRSTPGTTSILRRPPR